MNKAYYINFLLAMKRIYNNEILVKCAENIAEQQQTSLPL